MFQDRNAACAIQIAHTSRGCVTPTVIHNWIETTGGDMDLVDGFEELPEDAQEKLRRTFEQGHVDDDDWNGVCCPIPSPFFL